MENVKNRPEYTKIVAKNFTNKLKLARREHKLTQQELGELLGIDGKDISSLETNRRKPTLDELHKLCDLLNRTNSFFFPDGVPELKKKYIHKPRNNKKNFHSNDKVGKYGEPKLSKKELDELNNKVTKDGVIYDVAKEIEKGRAESFENLSKEESNIDNTPLINEVEVVNEPVISKGHVIKRKITITLPNGYYQNVAEGINITVEEEIIKE